MCSKEARGDPNWGLSQQTTQSETLTTSGLLKRGNQVNKLWSMMEKSSVSLIQRLSILRFCVKSWKGESESQIKYCLGTRVGMVERFITIQNFGQLTALRWNSRWIFPRVHRSAALQESPRVGDPSQFKGRFVFMLMFNDILWRSEDNEPNAMLTTTLCIFTKRFPEGRWSFLGLGSETKCLPRTKKDHEKSGFVISEQLILEQSVEIFEGVSHQLVKFFIETIVAGQWWTSHQSFACKGLCVLIFCVMFWEYAPELAIKYLLFGNTSWVGSYIHHNTELWTIDGSPMEFEWKFPRIHHSAARVTSPKAHEKNGRTRTIPKTNYLHVDVQWHHMRNYRQCEGMYC